MLPDITNKGDQSPIDYSAFKHQKSPKSRNIEAVTSEKEKDKFLNEYLKQNGPNNQANKFHSLINNLKINDKNYDRMSTNVNEIKIADMTKGS